MEMSNSHYCLTRITENQILTPDTAIVACNIDESHKLPLIFTIHLKFNVNGQLTKQHSQWKKHTGFKTMVNTYQCKKICICAFKEAKHG